MSFINSLYFLFLTYNLCLAEIRRRRTLFLMELAPVYKKTLLLHYYYEQNWVYRIYNMTITWLLLIRIYLYNNNAPRT